MPEERAIVKARVQVTQVEPDNKYWARPELRTPDDAEVYWPTPLRLLVRSDVAQQCAARTWLESSLRPRHPPGFG